MMSPYLAEFIGTMILVILGDGVVANVVLTKSKGFNGGWIAIMAGWGFAVAIAVYCVGSISGGHLNPAVTLAMAALGKIEGSKVAGYIVAQVAGAFAGAIVVWLAYLPHWGATGGCGFQIGCVLHGSGDPACHRQHPDGIDRDIFAGARRARDSIAREFETRLGRGCRNRADVGGSVGLGDRALAGRPTGYAINPARDFGPRLAYAILPIPGKKGADWPYAWIPIVAPIAGGLLGALFYKMCWHTV